MQGCDAVINLAGEPIAQRWSGHKKQDFVFSRVGVTERVVQAIGKLAQPPQVLVNASAVGYYGDRGANRLSEDGYARQRLSRAALPGLGKRRPRRRKIWCARRHAAPRGGAGARRRHARRAAALI